MRPTDIPAYIWLFSILLTVITFGVYLIRRKVFIKDVSIAAGVLVVSVVFDCIGYYFVQHKIITAFLYNLQDVIQFGLLSWFYYKIVFSRTGNRVFKTATALYIVFLFTISIFVQNPITKHQNYMWVISSVILILYAIYFCYDLLKTISSRRELTLNAISWINFGTLYYFTFSILLFLLFEIIVTQFSAEVSKLIWSFNNVNNIIKNCMILIGLTYNSERTSEP
jgi:hypothetical protein